MTNRLAASTSPYLQQHRNNPVDWWEWGEDAFTEAKRRDAPLLLSVGYAACHWCHVMARESFEDGATAALMNEHFVNVKVDREERPDVDAVYMSATTALSGHGGWPMTVFTTPDGRPFHAGTYYPPAPRGGMPSFRQLLSAVAEAWQERREDVEGAGQRITEALAGPILDPGEQAPTADRLGAAVAALAAEEDREHGGFGPPPKFPPSMVLEFLLRHAARTGLAGEPDGGATELAGRTLRAMAGSGMYDQLAGGFARYAVDRAWVVPHFEKMLYDNALLARVYLHWWRLTGEPAGARVAEETCDWLLAGLRTEQGGFASSLDADTPVAGEGHGVEGLTYVWTPQQLTVVLGDDAGWAARLLRVDAAGTFEHGTSTLQLDRDVWADEADAGRWVALRARLLAERDNRPQPHRDDKVVAAWNGLAVAALAETGALLGRPEFVHAAAAAADLLLRVHAVTPSGRVRPRTQTTGHAETVHAEPAADGLRLRRVSRDGRAGHPAGVLEDYGDVAEGLLALHAVTGSPRWLQAAGQLLETVLAHFRDEAGGFYDTPDDGTDAALAGIRRPQDPSDNAYPSGWSAAAGALLSYAALTGSQRHREAALGALRVVDVLADRAPRFAGWGLAVAEAAVDGPREVAVAGADGDGGRARLHAVALAGTAPGLVISAGEPDAEEVPLLTGRPLREQRATAYVCRGFVCDAPVTEADQLARALGTRSEVVESLGTALGMS